MSDDISWQTESSRGKAELVIGALDAGLRSAKEVAEALGTTRSAVLSCALRHNITLPGRSGTVIDDAMIVKIREAAKSMSLREVARRLGLDRGTVSKYARTG